MISILRDAPIREQFDSAQADARAGACHDRNFVFEFLSHDFYNSFHVFPSEIVTREAPGEATRDFRVGRARRIATLPLK